MLIELLKTMPGTGEISSISSTKNLLLTGYSKWLRTQCTLLDMLGTTASLSWQQATKSYSSPSSLMLLNSPSWLSLKTRISRKHTTHQRPESDYPRTLPEKTNVQILEVQTPDLEMASH